MIPFVVGTALILVFLTWASIQTASLLDRVPEGVNLLLLPAENILRLVLIAIGVGLGSASGLPFEQLGWQTIFPARDLIVGALSGAAIAAVLPLLTLIAIRAFGPSIYNPRLIIRLIPRNRIEWIIVPLVLVPAVFLEELLFRSFIIGGLGELAPALLLAVAGSILFGGLHTAQGPLGVVAAIGLGGFLAALFIATSGLLAPFIAHYVINVTQIAWAARDKSLLQTIRRLSAENGNSGRHL